MYLDAVSNLIDASASVETIEVIARTEVFEHWKDWHPSEISHHGKLCCEIAREWIVAADFSELSGDGVFTGPRWLRQKFNWGASRFPIHWCEAVRRKTLDCGALAAFAHEIFIARGVRSHRAQLVQKFSDVATGQWSNSWKTDHEPLPWIKDDLIYHEGVAIETRSRKVKVWDASAGWWVDPKPANGYGALLAIRLSGANLHAETSFAWGEHVIRSGEWKKIN